MTDGPKLSASIISMASPMPAISVESSSRTRWWPNSGTENQPMMIKKALEYLDARAKEDKPFFLYFSCLSAPQSDRSCGGVRGQKRNAGKEGKYGDWIYQGDHMLGRIMEALSETGRLRTRSSSQPGITAMGRSYEPLRDNKSSIYEGGHWNLSWRDGREKSNRVQRATKSFARTTSSQPAQRSSQDLPPDAAEDSVSLLPALLGRTRTDPRSNRSLRLPRVWPSAKETGN